MEAEKVILWLSLKITSAKNRLRQRHGKIMEK